jgi:hypothetical protein
MISIRIAFGLVYALRAPLSPIAMVLLERLMRLNTKLGGGASWCPNIAEAELQSPGESLGAGIS